MIQVKDIVHALCQQRVAAMRQIIALMQEGSDDVAAIADLFVRARVNEQAVTWIADTIAAQLALQAFEQEYEQKRLAYENCRRQIAGLEQEVQDLRFNTPQRDWPKVLAEREEKLAALQKQLRDPAPARHILDRLRDAAHRARQNCPWVYDETFLMPVGCEAAEHWLAEKRRLRAQLSTPLNDDAKQIAVQREYDLASRMVDQCRILESRPDEWGVFK
jgi:hypothetical protein